VIASFDACIAQVITLLDLSNTLC